MKKLVSRILTTAMAVALAGSLTACGGGSDSSGTYTNVIDSKTYFSAAEVVADMPEAESRPDGSAANVPLRGLMPLLDSRVAAEVETLSGGAMPDSAGVAEYYTVSLKLDGGKYTLTKKFNIDNSYSAEALTGMLNGKESVMELTFSGAYTEADGKVTLSVPEKIVANMLPCGDVASNYTRFAGGFENVEVTQADADLFPGKFFNYFSSLYFVDSGAASEMTVTVDKDANTFAIQ